MAATHTSALEEWDNPGHEFYYPKSTAPTLSPSNISADHGRAWKPHKDLFNMGITGTKNSQFPIRMNFMQGHPVKTYLTNHFEINITAKQLWEYEILDLDKGGHTRRNVRQLFNNAISTWPFLNENSGSFATDSVNTIISWVPLHHKISPGVHVEHKGDESAQIDDTSVVWSPMNVQDGRDGQDPIWARFRLVGKVDIAKLTSKSRSEARSEPESVGRDISHIERCLNVVISKSLTPEVVRLSGKKFYVRAGRSELLGTRGISASLEIIRGYYFAVKPGMGNLLMNFNIATSAFFRPILVSEFLNDDDTFSGFESRFDILKRLRVFVEYPRKTLNSAKPNEYPDLFGGAPARIKNITEKSFDDIEKLTFRKKKQDDQGNFRKDAAGNFMFENKDTHVYKHLEEVFGEKVQPGRKAINVGSETNKIWYAQEHLRIIPYQIYTRPVPDHLTGSMVNTAARDPDVARTLIENEGLSKLGISQVGDSKVSFPHNIPLELYPTMLRVPYQVLPFPQVKYDSANTKDKPIGQSGWNLRADHKFWPNKEVTTIKYYLIHGTSMANTKLGMSDVEKYEEAFRAQVCSRLSIPVANLQKVSHENTQIGNIENLTTDELDKEMKEKFRAAEDARADLMLLIIPAFNREIYRVYKSLADRVYSMRSICLTIKQDNLGKSQNMSKYMTNVAMKVNFKLGGVNTVVQELKNFGNDTLILGADVVHPGTAAFEGCPSIASIVGSIDQSATKYLGSMRLQSKPKMDREIIDDVKEMVYERIKDWSMNRPKDSKHITPSNIVYFRDGVSEGQYTAVLTQEVAKIDAAWQQYKKDKKPPGITFQQNLKITVVVGGKRHHTRFYPILGDGEDADPRGNRNCLPGTLVDRAVTSPYYRDFYLQSHSGIKGTARSTHYFVLKDGKINGLNATTLPSKIHALCYAYCRATTGVSYATPTYYADRLCERGRLYMPNTFNGNNEAMKTTLRKAKDEEVQRLKNARNVQFRPTNAIDYDYRVHGTKSQPEVDQEKQDLSSLDDFMRAQVLTFAQAEFYAHKKPDVNNNICRTGNPWPDLTGQHMFWM